MRAWLVRITLSGALLAAIGAVVPLGEVALALRGADRWPIALGFALVVPKLLTSGLRMLALVRAQNFRLGLGTLIAINLATSFYALFLPGQLVAGTVRWYKLARAEGQPAAALAVVGFSRLIELEVTLAIGLAFWVVDPQARQMHLLPALLVAAALAACIGIHAAGPSLAGRIAPRASGNGWGARAAAVAEAVGRFRRLTLRAQLAALGYSALTHLFGIATMVLFAWGLDSDVGFATLAWVRSLMAVLLLLPISWAGVGVREISLALLLTTFGVAAEVAVALGLLLSLRALLEGAMGALVEAKSAVRPRRPDPAGPVATSGSSPCASV
ncbi:MAG TPA: lysylphosphatidylglycerol synthase transmembrane domain-containing protein [Geminicoccaceae bacterium]